MRVLGMLMQSSNLIDCTSFKCLEKITFTEVCVITEEEKFLGEKKVI